MSKPETNPTLLWAMDQLRRGLLSKGHPYYDRAVQAEAERKAALAGTAPVAVEAVRKPRVPKKLPEDEPVVGVVLSDGETLQCPVCEARRQANKLSVKLYRQKRSKG